MARHFPSRLDEAHGMLEVGYRMRTHHFRRPWAETRGDQFSAWGSSEWFFEVEADGWVLRQMELYASGVTLQYDRTHVEDEFGALSEVALDLEEFVGFAISPAEFEQAWCSHRAHNRAA